MASTNPELTRAIQSNNAALVRDVLTRFPELRSKLDEPLPGYSFDTPALIAAVNNKNREMIDVLLQAGASINARTKWWAGGFGVLDVCDLHLAGFLIDRGAHVDIHAAARLGMLDRLKQLIATDPASVNARGGDGQTPLHFAANTEIAACLLDHGAELDTRDIDHESTAAQYMVSMQPCRLEAARYLVSRGAQTDILMAAALGDLDLVRRHLDADPASINISVSEKDFPKRNPHSGGIIYIFGFGWHKTPHMLARECGHEEVFQLLMQRSSPELQLTQACDVGDESLANQLATADPSLTQSLSPELSRRLIAAAMRNDTTAVRLMLAAGWPAGIQNDNGQTPLHWAAWHGNAGMVRLLLQYHAPLHLQENEYGGTPLDWARHGSQNSWHRETGDYQHTIQLLTADGTKTLSH